MNEEKSVSSIYIGFIETKVKEMKIAQATKKHLFQFVVA